MSVDNLSINGLRGSEMNGKTPVNTSKETENERVSKYEVKCETAEDILRFIMNKTLGISERLNKLEALATQLAENDSIFDSVLYTSFLNFCSSIISIYCNPTPNDHEELKMLIPLLSFVSTYGNAENVVSRYNDFVLHTMMACVGCVSSLLSQHKEFHKLTPKKNLIARARRVRNECYSTVLANMLGIPHFPENVQQMTKEPEISFEMFSLFLYAITNDENVRDINKLISKINILNPKRQNAVLDSERTTCGMSKCYKRIKEKQEEWTDVVIAHVFPFELVILCLKNNWQTELSAINVALMSHLPIMSDATYVTNMQSLDYKVGSVVGVWTTDVVFKWKPIWKTYCLRGLVLGKASHDIEGVKNVSWALWAIDVGTLMFSNKIWNLPTHLANIQPIACAGSLHEERLDKEEHKLLLILLRLLIKLLTINPNFAYHLFEPESETFEMNWTNFRDNEVICNGSAFLKLIKYPDNHVRILFLELLLLITRNSEKILTYLKRSCFYLTLCSRLEMCAYFCNSDSADDLFWSEIKTSLLLLKLIFSGNDCIVTGFYGWNYMEKVLKMYTLIDRDEEKCLASDCLFTFKNNNNTSVSAMVPFLNKIFTEKKVESEHLEGSLMTVDDDGLEGDQIQETKSKPPKSDVIRKFDFYVKGNKFEIQNDEMHVIFTQKSLYEVLEISISKSVCALMNGIGGTLYFGIDEENIVNGLRLSSEEMTVFRQGILRLMTNSIYPSIKSDHYSLNYFPVFNCGQKLKEDSSHENWIIELCVKPLVHTMYSISSEKITYIRGGRQDINGICLIRRQQAVQEYQREVNRIVNEVKNQISDTKDKILSSFEEFKE